MFRAAAALCALILFSFPSVGFATTILFQATDVADSIPGEDLWTYDYFVSGFGFDTDIGFSIEFDVGLYSQLEDPPPGVGSDWDIIAFQPDSLLPDAGLYDALALVDGASLALPFSISFVWLGAVGTTPGEQAFQINEFDGIGAFVGTLESGQTQVPEPSTALLMMGGFSILAIRRRGTLRCHGAMTTQSDPLR